MMKILHTKNMRKIYKNDKNLIKIAKIFNFLMIFVTFLTFNGLFLNNNTFAESYYYTDDVKHLFTHCLIAYPKIAFKKDNPMREHYNTDCITASEFKKILKQLYTNGYILVRLNDCFTTLPDGTAIKKKVKIPIGKKALVLSFDDVNYDHKKMGLGMVDKIIISNGKLASYTKTDDKIDISYDREFISILEDFIEKNPDFSNKNAKGVINLTGYDGILGYRTSHTNTVNRNQEVANAKKIVAKLKENGWEFASHSYGHYHMSQIDLKKWENEVTLWRNEVESLIGKTSIYVYPYGEWQVFENGEICEKHKLLLDEGFSLFCGVGMKDYFTYLPNKTHKVLFMDRKCIDGSTLRANRSELFPFFLPKTVLDTARFNN